MGRRFAPGFWAMLLLAAMVAGCVGAPSVRPPPSVPAAPVPRRQLSPQEVALEKAINEFDGSPYRNGGTTPAGVDCSGLVQGVYQRLGLKLPRTAALQYSEGQPVRAQDLRPGDVVFFNRLCQLNRQDSYLASIFPSVQTDEICHNGIYIGQGRFVHASRRGVAVSRLDEEVWSRSFMGARRFLAP